MERPMGEFKSGAVGQASGERRVRSQYVNVVLKLKIVLHCYMVGLQ
jgi:hypothetical protein